MGPAAAPNPGGAMVSRLLRRGGLLVVKTAWLFPGQGAQAVGMGRDVHDASAAARAVFAQADEALGDRLSAVCFEGPMAELTLTANTQPAILTTSAAILAALRERYPNLPPPVCAAGHSLGEYAALHAAGALPLADAVVACRVRGLAMQDAVPEGQGAMAAVMGLDGDIVAELCVKVEEESPGLVVSCANFNAAVQTVIAGNAATVAKVSSLAKQRGGKVIPLNVSAPFHCALMAPAREPLAEALAAASVSPPSFPVLANVDGAPKPDAEAIVEALLRQVDSPVQWVASVRKMSEMGVTHALEIGPGRVLAGLMRRVDKTLKVLSVNSQDSIEKVSEFLALEHEG
jgi:[acyl-carrier-protein] S-malonyltransferase